MRNNSSYCRSRTEDNQKASGHSDGAEFHRFSDALKSAALEARMLQEDWPVFKSCRRHTVCSFRKLTADMRWEQKPAGGWHIADGGMSQ